MLTIVYALLSFFAFPRLVESPVPTLARGLLPLAAVELLQGWLTTGKFFDTLLSLVLSFLLSLVFYALLVLFGAPFHASCLETALCAAHISLLTLQPLICLHSLSTSYWTKAVSLRARLDSSYGSSLGTLLGAWLGAIPIALDWDRPWQTWPITIVVGAYSGFIVGGVIGLFQSTRSPASKIKVGRTKPARRPVATPDTADASKKKAQ